MSKPAFTPGPWSVGMATGHNSNVIYSSGDQSVAQVYGLFMNCKLEDQRDGEDFANARLIAAAPDMYEALRLLSESGLLETLKDMDDAMKNDGDDPIAAPHMERIRAALAKAEGR